MCFLSCVGPCGVSLSLPLQELVRLLQQTVRSSQYDKYFASSRLSEGIPKDALELLHRKDEQILGLSGQLERLSLERESLQQEARTLKTKVGELSEQLGMLVETIQAKDEVIMKLSRRLSEGADGTSSTLGVPGSPTPASREQLELDRLKVSGTWALAARQVQIPLLAAPLGIWGCSTCRATVLLFSRSSRTHRHMMDSSVRSVLRKGKSESSDIVLLRGFGILPPALRQPRPLFYSTPRALSPYVAQGTVYTLMCLCQHRAWPASAPGSGKLKEHGPHTS